MSANSSSNPIQTYDATDLEVTTTVTADIILNKPSITDLQNALKITDSNAYQQTIFEQTGTQANLDNLTKFSMMTDMLAQMNESYNANQYISKNLNSEWNRIADLDVKTKRDINKVRQKYLYALYMVNEYKFRVTIVKMWLFWVLVCLSLECLRSQGAISGIVLAVVSFVLLVAMLIAMVIMYRMQLRRRKYQWNKFYFSLSPDMKKKLKEPSPEFSSDEWMNKCKTIMTNITGTTA